MSQNTDITDRLRAANPASITPSDNAELFAAIVASPGDPRLQNMPTHTGAINRWFKRHTSRGTLIAVALLVTACGAAGITAILNNTYSQFAHDTPLKLFSANPGVWNPQYRLNRHTGVIPASVTHLETFQIQGFGAVQYWVAQTKRGDWCAAFRLPDGVWAGTTNDPNYSFGGAVPACTGPGPGGYAAGPHFTYTNANFTRLVTPHNSIRNRTWTIAYGILRNLTGAVRVRDATTGLSTPVLNGHDFAMLIPNHLVLAIDTPGGCSSCGPHTKIWFAGPPRLEALNAAGKVIARASVFP